MRRLHNLLGVAFLLLLALQPAAFAAPVSTSVDHRVVVTYSLVQFDGKSGTYSTDARIKNRSGASLSTPLRLEFDQTALNEMRLLNAQGVGKNNRPYFEIQSRKGMLPANEISEPVRIAFALKEPGETARAGDSKGPLSVLALAQRVSGGVEIAPLQPRAEPYALTAGSGKVNVRFSVRMVGTPVSSTTVYLRRSDARKSVAMNDKGRDGDLIAKDGIYGVTVVVDTSRLKPDACLNYEAFFKAGRTEIASAPLPLCISAFPVRVASSSDAVSVSLRDGTRAVADEILFTAAQDTRSNSILRIAADFNAKVVGSIPPLNLYQLKLLSPVTADRLSELVTQLRKKAGVSAASVNALGSYAYTPSDPEFSSQHGLRLVRAHDVWDIALAPGNGVTIAVLDSGLDRTHPDFGTAGNCQLAENDCDAASTDAIGHGTQVAGVVGAMTNNGVGVAGIAYGSKIHSIKVSPDATISDAEMTQGFTDAAAYGIASVVNASFSSLNAFANWTPVCAAIESVVVNSGVPVAVVANAVGNAGANGNYYPGRCNDLNAGLTRKDLFITVANSVSMPSADCMTSGVQNPVDTRCSTSNYGAWVDIAAPGSVIRTTTPGGYASPTGTSFSAPMVAGAAAILKSCGVALDQIEPTLKTSGANVHIAYPPGGVNDWWPRLDIFEAMKLLDHPPAGVGLSGSGIRENTNTSGGYEVGTLSTGDPDTCDKHTYSIVGGADSAAFSIGGANNDKLLLTAGVLDLETKSSYAVTVRVTDFFGKYSETPLTVNVINVNEAPAGTDGAVSAAEDTPYSFQAVDFGFTDPADLPAANNLSAVITTTLPTTGVLQLGGVALAAGQSVAVADLGNLTFTSALNANGAAYSSFTFQVVDDGGTANGGANTDPTPNMLTVNVTAANDAPTGLPNISGTVTEDQTLTADTGAIADADGLGAFSHQWRRGGADIVGATGSSYTLGDADVGQVIGVLVTYTDAGGTPESLTSNPTAPVANLNDLPNGTPVIQPPATTATRKVDLVLTADTSLISDADGPANLSFHYQWKRDATHVGTDANTYKLVATDVGGLMSLCVTYTDAWGKLEGPLCSVADAVVVGDPHITTVDKLHYDFQGAGEFVALRGANGMEIQVRQTPVSTAAPLTDGYSGLSVGVSINTAIAARVDNRRVTFQPGTSSISASMGLELRVDGVLTTPPPNGLDLGSGGRVLAAPNGGIRIDFPDETTMIATPGWWSSHSVWYLNVTVLHTPAYEGIMGARTKGSWLPRLADGSSLGPMPAALSDRYLDLYVKFADSWRVNDKSSLFDYGPETSTKTFAFAGWPKAEPPHLAPRGPVAKPAKREAAQRVCRDVAGRKDKADCVFDVMVTGNAGFAKTYLLSQKIVAGLTSIVVRNDKVPARPDETVTFTATVVPDATITSPKSGGKAAPAGTVQFTLNGAPVGKPVKLDAKGQARWKVTGFKPAEDHIAAHYIPAVGSGFLPSISRDKSHSVAGKGDEPVRKDVTPGSHGERK